MSDSYLSGRGAQSNPGNSFLSRQFTQEHWEGIDEDVYVSPQRQIIYDYPKNIISKSESPDIRMMYSINPYQGCEHGCIYCYARNSHEYWGFSAGIDFEQKIVVKPDAPRLLEAAFQRRSWRVAPIALSGNTDCYQPIERELKITQQLLQVFLKYGNPVGIITKNRLIERDLPLLKELASERLIHVYFSITTQDEQLRSKMEPRTASVAKRLATLEALSAAGVPCGAMIAPIIPSLNDHEIPSLVRQVAEAGALSVGYTVVRLNKTIGPLFKEWLTQNFPDRANKVWKQVQSLHGGQVHDSQWGRRIVGEGPISDHIAQLFKVSKQKYLDNRQMPAYDLSRFNRSGSYRLF
uniref:PA0069 family radical SAM protein n=1 Tax=Roseihalotalea indica TaxID=2867963 RepID=A0AA49GQN1_9BACT|nr:PA0069 family radical SAM protein [Tunicatimonas sp. TK19036]